MSRKRTTSLLAGLMLAAASMAFATPPEGFIEINYHRCDGKYEKWGAHLWQDPNMPLDGITWAESMKPTGTTDFGLYWHRKAEEFGPKMKVNYIIHKGDIKEQGGKDMAFDGKQHKAIWVINGDRTIYYSLEEAMKDHICKK
jgi:hypothetical protein